MNAISLTRRKSNLKKAKETLEDTIEISSTKEVSSRDESNDKVVAKEVLITRTSRKITKKVTRKLLKKPTELEILNVTKDLPPKNTQKKRKPLQLKKPLLYAS
ncbi:hypothetical protein BDW02DRAFT_583386 [Decorospora gaudefroyi]|uniref:Uncharacterized protein n=1 Tax=Decorospora gaudefroyi TaxID=184978 RepID=A0A6A5JY01_9PLEO|nr:hypothetical protein BDW02DRAFT_583386 [Decorospora gaudefroyi]